MKYDKYEKKILVYLDNVGIPQTTKRISERTQISWITTKNKLKNLKKKGIVSKGSFSENKHLVYWRLNE